MDICELSEVLLQERIFPFLTFNDLLRLRRVCKILKAQSEEYIRCNHVNVSRDIEITQEPSDRSLAAFLTMNIPFTRIYLDNTDIGFFKDPNIPQFLERFGSGITHLRVRNFFAFIDITEMPFYEELNNLQHLEFKNMDVTQLKCKCRPIVPLENGKPPPPPYPVAKTFAKLKTLKFGHIETKIENNYHDHGYWNYLVLYAYELLEYISYPKYGPDAAGPPIPLDVCIGLHNENTGTFRCVENVIGLRCQDEEDSPNLKYFDLCNFELTQKNVSAIFDYLCLVRLCNACNVKLLNVPADLYRMVQPCEENHYRKFVVPLVSLKNLHHNLFLKELPSLEKVVVTATSACSYTPCWSKRRGKPKWPYLNTLDLTIDSVLLRTQGVTMLVSELLEFLFTDVVREKLVDLSLRFNENAGKLPCPRTTVIKSSCPNIKRLTLERWVGTNKSLSLLWGGVLCLEELLIIDCKGLGNVAFVGESVTQPTFLKLKKLKYLTLSGLEMMPKVTDTVFTLVFRHLPLQKFFLTSRIPIKSISTSGIKSLLSGKFAHSIEKFPFTGWSVTETSPDEFRILERQFRSYFMI